MRVDDVHFPLPDESAELEESIGGKRGTYPVNRNPFAPFERRLVGSPPCYYFDLVATLNLGT